MRGHVAVSCEYPLVVMDRGRELKLVRSEAELQDACNRRDARAGECIAWDASAWHVPIIDQAERVATGPVGQEADLTGLRDAILGYARRWGLDERLAERFGSDLRSVEPLTLLEAALSEFEGEARRAEGEGFHLGKFVRAIFGRPQR